MGYVVTVILTLIGLGAIPFGMDHLDRRLAGRLDRPAGWRAGPAGAERACPGERRPVQARPAGRVAVGCTHAAVSPGGVVHDRVTGLHGPLAVDATPLPRPRHHGPH